MTKEMLLPRTKRFAFNILRLVDKMPETRVTKILGAQLLRSGTSIGANYRAACRAKSGRDFINKLKIVEEETDETIYWLELVEASNADLTSEVLQMKEEAQELVSMIVASIKTTRKRLENKSATSYE